MDQLGLPPELVLAVTELGYNTPTPVQVAAVPLLLEGKDVMAQARTGTGKTAAFALPMIAGVDPAVAHVQGLVLAPTRELATQVARAISRYGQPRGVAAVPIYGGQPYAIQRKRLETCVIVVGTPGRTMDLAKRGTLDLSGVRFLAIDEADEMLRLGFIDDVEAILALTPSERQTSLFSATLPPPIARLAEKYMRNPVRVGEAEGPRTVEGVEQRYYVVESASKLAALTRLLEVEDVERGLVFARTRVGVAALAEALLARGFAAEALHGDLPQHAREAALMRFRKGHTKLLVATDVAARGLDVAEVSHVFNYDFPDKPQEYVHRIGRTARAGREGVAISLALPTEQPRVAEVGFFTRSTLARKTMPTIAEVHALRDQRFAARVEELVNAGDLSRAAGWVDGLVAAGYDARTIAAAALHLARAAEAARPDENVREVFPRSERRPARMEGPPARGRGAERPLRGQGPVERGRPGRGAERAGPAERGRGVERPVKGRSDRQAGFTTDRPAKARADRPPASTPDRPAPAESATTSRERRRAARAVARQATGQVPMVRLTVDLGKANGIRPADIVSTVAREAGVPGEAIGSISVERNRTHFDVQEALVARVLRKLRSGFHLRGQEGRVSRES